MTEPRSDLTQKLFAVITITALTAMSIWVVSPFLGAGVWATMIAVSLWPVMLKIQKWLGGRRWAAVSVMTVGLLALLVVPLLFTIAAVVSNLDEIKTFAAKLPVQVVPAAPDWLAHIPVAGEKLAASWNANAGKPVSEVLAKSEPYLQSAAGWLAGKAGDVGGFIVQFLLTVGIAAVMFAGGERAARGIQAFAHRLAPGYGEGAVKLAGGAIRAVAMGVVVTAIVQSVFAGIGLAIAGVPFTAALTVLMFILCVAQLGPAPVMIVATLWIFKSDGAGWGIFMAVWTVIAGAINNVLQPMLIKKGVTLPFLLVFVGVVGGLLSLGLIGIFVGPVVLAVAYTLVGSWVNAGDAA